MPASNEEFIKRAFEAGLTEDQVRSAVKERNQKLAQTPQAETPQNQPGFLQKISDFLGAVSPTVKNVKTAVSTPAIGQQADILRKSSDSSFSASQKLIDQAKNEQDPLKKRKLLDASKAIMQGIAPRS